SAPRFITSIFSRRCVSTKGPFFSERLIRMFDLMIGRSAISIGVVRRSLNHRSPIRLFLLPLDDELIRPLPIPRLVALRRQPPWRHGVAAARGLAFTAAERMIDRVHRDAAHVRTNSEPPAATRL